MNTNTNRNTGTERVKRGGAERQSYGNSPYAE